MKILQITASYKPAYIYGGPTMSVSMLCEQLVKAGVQTDVFTTTANGINELPVLIATPIDVDGVTVIYFKRITKDHSHFSPGLLKTLWKETKNYDIIHIHAWWNLVSVLSCAIALMRKVPIILSPRGTLSVYSFNNKSISKKKCLQLLGGQRMLKKCHIHVTSEIEQKAIKALLKPKSITSVPNFVKLPAQKPIYKTAPRNYLNLLFFSRIEEKKGLNILLEALPLITIPYRLTIAGNGDENYIQSLKSLVDGEINEKISWAGFQNENKFDIFQEHDLLILPSHDENFGNVVIESLCVGTAVLISENVGLTSYVKTNNMGWICQANTASVSDAINEINFCKFELDRIRQEAPTKIYTDFNEDNLVKEYINMYNQIINS